MDKGRKIWLLHADNNGSLARTRWTYEEEGGKKNSGSNLELWLSRQGSKTRPMPQDAGQPSILTDYIHLLAPSPKFFVTLPSFSSAVVLLYIVPKKIKHTPTYMYNRVKYRR
jgi:hypothetical protein